MNRGKGRGSGRAKAEFAGAGFSDNPILGIKRACSGRRGKVSAVVGGNGASGIS